MIAFPATKRHVGSRVLLPLLALLPTPGLLLAPSAGMANSPNGCSKPVGQRTLFLRGAPSGRPPFRRLAGHALQQATAQAFHHGRRRGAQKRSGQHDGQAGRLARGQTGGGPAKVMPGGGSKRSGGAKTAEISRRYPCFRVPRFFPLARRCRSRIYAPTSSRTKASAGALRMSAGEPCCAITPSRMTST